MLPGEGPGLTMLYVRWITAFDSSTLDPQWQSRKYSMESKDPPCLDLSPLTWNLQFGGKDISTLPPAVPFLGDRLRKVSIDELKQQPLQHRHSILVRKLDGGSIFCCRSISMSYHVPGHRIWQSQVQTVKHRQQRVIREPRLAAGP